MATTATLPAARSSSPEDSRERDAKSRNDSIPLLLWDWDAVLNALGIPKRTLQRELSAGRFVKPDAPGRKSTLLETGRRASLGIRRALTMAEIIRRRPDVVLPFR